MSAAGSWFGLLHESGELVIWHAFQHGSHDRKRVWHGRIVDQGQRAADVQLAQACAVPGSDPVVAGYLQQVDGGTCRLVIVVDNERVSRRIPIASIRISEHFHSTLLLESLSAARQDDQLYLTARTEHDGLNGLLNIYEADVTAMLEDGLFKKSERPIGPPENRYFFAQILPVGNELPDVFHFSYQGLYAGVSPHPRRGQGWQRIGRWGDGLYARYAADMQGQVHRFFSMYRFNSDLSIPIYDVVDPHDWTVKRRVLVDQNVLARRISILINESGIPCLLYERPAARGLREIVLARFPDGLTDGELQRTVAATVPHFAKLKVTRLVELTDQAVAFAWLLQTRPARVVYCEVSSNGLTRSEVLELGAMNSGLDIELTTDASRRPVLIVSHSAGDESTLTLFRAP